MNLSPEDREVLAGVEQVIERHVAAALAIAERIAYAYAETVDGEWGCCHSADDLKAGGRAPEFDGDEFQPIGDHCPGRDVLDVWLPQIADAIPPP